MANPTADDLNKLIDDGKFDEFVDAFVNGCRTWRRDDYRDYGDVLIRLYELQSPEGLDALEKVLGHSIVYKMGPWKGIKKIYKLSEEKRDPRFFGLIARAIDVNWGAWQITLRTRHYIKRRVWRFLRTLPKKDPKAYAGMALGLLVRYTDSDVMPRTRCKLWAYNHVGWHGTERGGRPGNSAYYYTTTRWRQRQAKRYWWQRDEWDNSSTNEYPFGENWRGQLFEILDGLARAKAGVTAELLIAIARAECQSQFKDVTLDHVLKLFESSLNTVHDLAIDMLNEVPPDRIPESFIIALLDRPEPRLQAFAMEFIGKHWGLKQLGLQRVLEFCRHSNAAIAAWAVRIIREEADPNDLSWESIATWFDSKHPEVRKEALELAEKYWTVWKPSAKSIFDLICALPHPDVHQAGFKWLVEKFRFADFNREDVLDLFDSDWADVREFAKQFVIKHFDELRALEDLARLAEHPDPALQHWVVELVHQHLRADADRLVKLMPFFRQVVFHVNRGAPEKLKIFAMLIDLAADSRARAEAVVTLCAEFVRAYGRAEFVKSLVGLARLRSLYADLNVPIELIPPESRRAESRA